MIAFASAITKPDVYDRVARVGIDRVREPDSTVIEMPATGTVFETYNAILERVAALEDLEALVLVHQDTEIVTPAFCDRVREALTDPGVGVVGCVGAVDVRSIAWWEGSVTCASFVHRHEDAGGGDLPGFSWDWEVAPPYARLGEVDTVDGFLLVLSPWTVGAVRFDESLGRLHGYDVDLCLQVRSAGRKVVTADFKAIHVHPLRPIDDLPSWIEAHIRLAEKWDGRIPGFGTAAGTWKQRALRAEAETDATRALDVSARREAQAHVRALERELMEAHTSVSWRLASALGLARRRRVAQ